uniref:Calponin n=1 Tax=Callithrix jacchus TaxID=9483 RepID=A0A8I3WUH9_CALJA
MAEYPRVTAMNARAALCQSSLIGAASSTQFNKGPLYRLSAEVKNPLLSKYDPQKKAELRSWIEGLTHLSIGPNFQKGLKDGIILCTFMNKLLPGSVPKINRSMQNWHQLENLSNFIKAIVSYGMNPMDLFEANGLFESGNMTQAKTKGLQSGVGIGVKYWEKQERNFDDATMKTGQCVIGLQMGTNKCASQSGMTAYGTRRHLYDPKNHILTPMDHSTISLQMGTNKCASHVGMTAPGMRRHIYDTKLGTDKCDNCSMSLQMGYMQGANQSGQVLAWAGRYTTPSTARKAQWLTGLPPMLATARAPGRSLNIPLTTRRRRTTKALSALAPHVVSLSGFLGFSGFSSLFF